MGCFRTMPVRFLIAEGGSRPAEAIVRGRKARFHAQILGRPPPPTPTRQNKVSAMAETIRRLLTRMADLCGMTKVEPTAPRRFTRPRVGMIMIEPAKEAEAMAWQWEMLGTECFWTDGSHLEGHTGAAVVRLSEGKFQAREFYLGTSMEVFDVELYTLYEALCGTRRLLDTGHAFRKVAIFSDAQAGLLHLQTDDEGHGQCIGRRISWEEQEPQSRKVSVEY
jgi:hypothetical protein